jgi:hypothetical protein
VISSMVRVSRQRRANEIRSGVAIRLVKRAALSCALLDRL